VARAAGAQARSAVVSHRGAIGAALPEIAEVETKNNGKPLFESKIDVAMAVETFRYYAGWADKLTGDTLPVSGNFFTYTLREPVG